MNTLRMNQPVDVFFQGESSFIGSGRRRVIVVRTEPTKRRVRIEELSTRQRFWLSASVWQELLNGTRERQEKAETYEETQARKRGSEGAVKPALQAT